MTNIYPNQDYLHNRSKSFQEFVVEDFKSIQKQFNQLGYKVISHRDFDTYQGWLERGRKVAMGQKAVNVETSRTHTKPIFKNHRQPFQPNSGKTRFYRKKINYCLFHKTQTNFNQIPKEL